MVRERNVSLRGLIEASCQPRMKTSCVVNIAVKVTTILTVSLYIEAIQIRILKCPLIIHEA